MTFIVIYRHHNGVLDMLRNLAFGVMEFESEQQAITVWREMQAIDAKHKRLLPEKCVVCCIRKDELV